MLPHERFDAWKSGHELAVTVYQVTTLWPVHERYGLTSQTRRAAVSIVTNIAEGSARRGRHEFQRYLNISLGSLAELGCLLRVALDVGVVTTDDWERLDQLRDATGKRLWGLYRALRS